MIARQELLMLKRYVPPMVVPGATEPIDASAFRVRSLAAHVALVEWATRRLAEHQAVGVTRAVLNAAGCLSTGAVHTNIVVAHAELSKFRQLGALLIGPECVCPPAASLAHVHVSLTWRAVQSVAPTLRPHRARAETYAAALRKNG